MSAPPPNSENIQSAIRQAKQTPPYSKSKAKAIRRDVAFDPDGECWHDGDYGLESYGFGLPWEREFKGANIVYIYSRKLLFRKKFRLRTRTKKNSDEWNTSAASRIVEGAIHSKIATATAIAKTASCNGLQSNSQQSASRFQEEVAPEINKKIECHGYKVQAFNWVNYSGT